jgi:hypothetical protein
MMEFVHQIRQDLDGEIDVLTQLMAADEPDREAIAAQVGKIASLREQMDIRVVEHFLIVRPMLDPDQQETLNRMIRRAFSRGGPGRGGLGGPHGPRKGPGHGRRGPSHDKGDEYKDLNQTEKRP